MAKRSHTAFQFGFSLVGKRESMVGEDKIGLFDSPETIPANEDYIPRGTPVKVANDGSGNPVITLVSNDEVPDGLIFERIDDSLSDFELIKGLVDKDEILPGDKANFVPFKKNAVIQTDLIDDDSSTGFALEEDVYVKKTTDNNPKFTNSNDAGTRTNTVGKIIGIEDDYIQIMLK